MVVTGTGMFGLPLERLRTLLSSLTAVQEWMGVDALADPQGEATKHIYINQLPDNLEQPGTTADFQAAKDARPLMVIGTAESFQANEETTGTPWPRTGDLWLDFEELAQNDIGPEATSNDVTDPDALMHMMNNAGAIMAAAEVAVSTTAATALVDNAVLDMVGYDLLVPAARTAFHARRAANGVDACGMKITIRRRDR